MTAFEPHGDGWRLLEVWEDVPLGAEVVTHSARHGDLRRWIRDQREPVQLPTEPWTVIELHGDDSAEGRIWVREVDDFWREPGFKVGQSSNELLAALGITGFTVLAAPPATDGHEVPC